MASKISAIIILRMQRDLVSLLLKIIGLNIHSFIDLIKSSDQETIILIKSISFQANINQSTKRLSMSSM
jgi:hypothetical protein